MLVGQGATGRRHIENGRGRCRSATSISHAKRSILKRPCGKRFRREDEIILGKKKINSRAYASWFNFKGRDQQQRSGTLSGGQRNRVHLAKLLQRGCNLLLLDEPTNDLDVDTLRALEQALLGFPGCVVVISHDRWFLDRIATHMLAFEGDSQWSGSRAISRNTKKTRRGVSALMPTNRIASNPEADAMSSLRSTLAGSASAAKARRTFAACTVALCLSALLFAPQDAFLSIATGGTGGVIIRTAARSRRLISEKDSQHAGFRRSHRCGRQSQSCCRSARSIWLFTLADSLAEGVKGEGPFKATGAIGSARTLAVLYTNFTHIVVRQGSGIRSIADLKGKAVSVGAPGSGTELIANRVLMAAGLDPRRDITRYALSVTESAGSLKDGKIDALFWSGRRADAGHSRPGGHARLRDRPAAFGRPAAGAPA
jgi:energy-coupling factor transporter ATP-binding protein EcfA2